MDELTVALNRVWLHGKGSGGNCSGVWQMVTLPEGEESGRVQKLSDNMKKIQVEKIAA